MNAVSEVQEFADRKEPNLIFLLAKNLIRKGVEKRDEASSIAVATMEADEAIHLIFSESCVFLSPTQKGPTGVILVSFDHFASSDFNV